MPKSSNAGRGQVKDSENDGRLKENKASRSSGRGGSSSSEKGSSGSGSRGGGGDGRSR